MPFHRGRNLAHHSRSERKFSFKRIGWSIHVKMCREIDRVPEEGATWYYYCRSMLKMANQGQ